MGALRAPRHGLPARLRRSNLRADQRNLFRLEARIVLGRIVESWGGLRNRLVAMILGVVFLSGT